MTQDIASLRSRLLPVFLKYQNELVAAYLFGSLASETQTVHSDIDIAILPKDRDPERAVLLKLQLYTDLCRVLKRNDIDLVVLDLSGNLILNASIIRTGILLYSVDDDYREDFELKLLHTCIDFEHQRCYAIGE